MRLIRNKYLQYLLVGAAFLLPVLLRGVPTATVTLAASMVYTAIAGLGINVLVITSYSIHYTKLYEC